MNDVKADGLIRLLRFVTIIMLLVLVHIERRHTEAYRKNFDSMEVAFHRMEAAATNAQWIAAEAIRQRNECQEFLRQLK